MKNFILCTLSIVIIFSCKKVEDGEPLPPSTTIIKVNDTMRLNSSYATSDASFYAAYNNKYYSDTEINGVGNFTTDADGVIIQIKDPNTTKGNLLVVKISGKNLDNVTGSYELAGNANVKYTQSQNFYGGSISQANPKSFEGGTLSLVYFPTYNKISGSLTNAKHYIGVYVPYQTSSAGITQTTSQSNTLMLNFSTRTYNVGFDFIDKL